MPEATTTIEANTIRVLPDGTVSVKVSLFSTKERAPGGDISVWLTENESISGIKRAAIETAIGFMREVVRDFDSKSST